MRPLLRSVNENVVLGSSGLSLGKNRDVLKSVAETESEKVLHKESWNLGHRLGCVCFEEFHIYDTLLSILKMFKRVQVNLRKSFSRLSRPCIRR